MPNEPIDVAVYGIVNAGKSSLINALAGREVAATAPTGGTTRSVQTETWKDVQAEVGPYTVRLIDTPGIQEVGDAALEQLATETARRSDLILFLTAEDLTGTAQAAVKALHLAGKPLLVCLNKMDLLEPAEQVEVLDAVRRRLEGVIPAECVVQTAAAPIVREWVVSPDGSTSAEVRRGVPDVAELEARLAAAIAESAPALKALNEAAQHVEKHVSERDADRAARRSRAEAVADETSVALALALAVNPVPLLDFLASSGGAAVLIKRVAGVYGEEPSAAAIQQVSRDLVATGSLVLWGSVAAMGVGGALKFLPGLGHLAGALAQGTAGGYVAHLMGRALVDYYENGHDWGDGGLAATLERIAASTDRRALTRGLVDQLRARLGRSAK